MIQRGQEQWSVAVAMEFKLKQMHRMNRCRVIGVSGRHRINRRMGFDAICSVSVEENQVWPDDPTCGREERRTNGRIVYQRACLGDQGTLLRAGWSDAPSDKGVGIMTSALQAQKKKTLQDRMNQRPVGVTGRSIWWPPHQPDHPTLPGRIIQRPTQKKFNGSKIAS